MIGFGSRVASLLGAPALARRNSSPRAAARVVRAKDGREIPHTLSWPLPIETGGITLFRVSTWHEIGQYDANIMPILILLIWLSQCWDWATACSFLGLAGNFREECGPMFGAGFGHVWKQAALRQKCGPVNLYTVCVNVFHAIINIHSHMREIRVPTQQYAWFW